MTEAIRPLPILTPDKQLPTAEALVGLRLAKKLSGYAGLVIPSQAVLGSPGPILAVGCEPDWLVRFAKVSDWSNQDALNAAVDAILNHPDDPRIAGDEYLLSKWFQGPVKLIREESYGPVFA